MKRWIWIVFIALFLVSVEPGVLPAAAAEEERWTVDPMEMPEELIRFLDWFGWYGMFGSWEYDASEIDEENNILGGVFELCMDFDAYPGEGTEQWITGDPRGRWGSCYGYDGEKADWILQNIFHYTPEDIARARAWGDEDPAGDYYYEDGMYYVFQGGVGGGFDVYPCYVETDGEIFYVTYISYMGDGYTTLEGIHYAEVSPREIDGHTWWTLLCWCAEPPAAEPENDPVLGDLAGEWVLAGELDSGLNIDTAPDGTAVLDVWFYRMAAFTAEAMSQPDGKTAIFTDSDPDSGFSGWLTREGDRLLLHVIPMPSWGEDPWSGFFDGSFEFHRAGNGGAPADPAPQVPADASAPFSITPEELEREIESIRGCYYDPEEGDQRITLQNGTDGWNYSRDYTFHNGRLAFAFIFDGTEEHRLYFKDDHMIRYIDETHTVYDFGELVPFSDWEARALEEAYTLVPPPESDDLSLWLGVWTAGEESLEVTSVSDSAVTLIYHGLTADGGSMFHTEYVLPFLGGSKARCGEPDSVLEAAGWRYVFTFHGDHITMSSRYPDRDFWK